MNDFAKPGLGQTELPPVNSDDNGKVLGVNNGMWDKVAASGGLPSTGSASAGDVLTLDNSKDPQWAAPSGGGGVFLVTINYDESENADVLDKTWQEIHDAFVIDGKQIIFTYATNPLYPDYHSYYTLVSVTYEESNPYMVCLNHNGSAEVYSADTESDYPAFYFE